MISKWESNQTLGLLYIVGLIFLLGIFTYWGWPAWTLVAAFFWPVAVLVLFAVLYCIMIYVCLFVGAIWHFVLGPFLLGKEEV